MCYTDITLKDGHRPRRKRYEKKIKSQQKIISIQSEQIENLNVQIAKLKLEIEEKDIIINSISHLRDELIQKTKDIDEYKENYKKLIDELKKMKEILNQEIIDSVCIVKDEEALKTSKDLAAKEGILCGISSGTNVAAALRLARLLGKGKRVVTVLPDTAERYFSTPLFEE